MLEIAQNSFVARNTLYWHTLMVGISEVTEPFSFSMKLSDSLPKITNYAATVSTYISSMHNECREIDFSFETLPHIVAYSSFGYLKSRISLDLSSFFLEKIHTLCLSIFLSTSANHIALAQVGLSASLLGLTINLIDPENALISRKICSLNLLIGALIGANSSLYSHTFEKIMYIFSTVCLGTFFMHLSSIEHL